MFVDFSTENMRTALADRRMNSMKRVMCMYKAQRLLTRGYRLYRYRRSWLMDLAALTTDDDRINAVMTLGMGPLAPCDDPVEASGTLYYNSVADDYTVYLRLLMTAFTDQNDMMHWIMYNECFILCIFMFKLCQIAWPERRYKIAVNMLHSFVIDEFDNVYDPIVWFMMIHDLPVDARLVDISNVKTYKTVHDYMIEELCINQTDNLYMLIMSCFT